jgi:hypothetical protein
MAMASWVRCCEPVALRVPVKSQVVAMSRGIEGGHVASREQTKTLKVLCSFEPSRMAQACLEDAYEYVLPIVRRVVAGQRQIATSAELVSQRRVGGVS